MDSASLELDEAAGVLSYEEYHPYGSTAFHSAKAGAEVSAKRYRYTGKEKDEESGLYYHGARYYAAWLGRWTAADPAGLVDGLNLYRYSRDNPVNFSDPGGTQSVGFNEDQTEYTDKSGIKYSYHENPEDPFNPDPELVFPDDPITAKAEEKSRPRPAPVSNSENSREMPVEASEPAAEPDKNETVGEPGLVESLIPIWGSGRSAINSFQNGDIGWGLAYTALAVSDVFLVKAIAVGVGKIAAKSVAQAAAKETAMNVAKNEASRRVVGELTHLTNPVAERAIAESGELGGRWGIFALESGSVPSSNLGRQAASLVPGNLSSEVKIASEAAEVFARPPVFGPFSATRAAAGVRSTPLGSLSLRTGECTAGQIFRNWCFQGGHSRRVRRTSGTSVLVGLRS